MTRLTRMGRADPRSAAAAALSFLFPGLGQAYNRRWYLAAALAAPVALLVALGCAIVVLEGRWSVADLVDTNVLVAILVLDLGLLGWRVVAILQAHAERSRLSLRGWPTWLTAALVAIAVGMHAVPAMYALTAIETLSSVSLEGGDGAFGDRAGNGFEMPRPSHQPELGDRITVLLVGIDFAPGRTQQLTDTLLVASLDPATGAVAMISIPRDLYGVPLGDGRTYEAKLNSLLAAASADPVAYPRGGAATLKAAVAELLQTRIHYVAAIDMQGMRQLIDRIGGVDVVVERTINDPHYRDDVTGTRGFSIPAGAQHLDGETAMAYVRSRMAAGESDFTRAARQQQVLTAMARKLSGGNLLLTLPALMSTVRDSVSTDIPSARVETVAAGVESANLDSIEHVVLTPDDGYLVVDPFSAAGYVLHPDLDAIRAMAARVFEDPQGSDGSLRDALPSIDGLP